MNFILKEYENIIKNNNTAQLQLIYILENTPKNINELIINEVLHGNLDFSILEEKGFNNLKNIIFSMKGEVTEIIGLPSYIQKLHCNDQFLLQLTDLPTDLYDLDCKNNHIQNINLLKCTKLKKLQISNNHIETIEHLPSSLEELYCNDNQIKSLNLIHLTHLHILHTSNNKTIIIIGLPPSVVDFVSENNPRIEFENCTDDTPATNTELQNKINYLESLNKYFKLKNKYEQQLYTEKRKIYLKKQKSILSKKPLKQTTFIAKCINCKQKGGSIFKCQDRTYTAVCGNTNSPCNLNIEIYTSRYFNNEEYLKVGRESLEEIKTDIICKKMDAVFNYTSNSVASQSFKNLINEYEDNHQQYTKTLEQHNNNYYGDVRQKCIEDKTKQIFEIILAIKKLLNEYSKTDNLNILKTAVEIQIKELFPEIYNLRMLKYEIMEMNHIFFDNKLQNIMNTFNEIRGEQIEKENNEANNLDNNINGSVLVQYITALHKIESHYTSPKVVKFITS